MHLKYVFGPCNVFIFRFSPCKLCFFKMVYVIYNCFAWTKTKRKEHITYLTILKQTIIFQLETNIVLKQRISIPEIRNHEWFLKNLPADLIVGNTTNDQFQEPEQPMQSVEEIMQIISEATIPAAGTHQSLNQYLTGSLDIDDEMDEDVETDPDLDIDSSGEIVYAM